MRRAPFFLLVAGALLLTAGCATKKEAADGGATTTAAAKKKKAQPAQNGATVYIDGRRRAAAPATVRVRRSYGESEVAIHVKGKEVRHYELERARTASSTQLDMGFGNDDADGGKRYDVSQLPKRKEVYLIPYSPGPVTIEDRDYAVTLVVIY